MLDKPNDHHTLGLEITRNSIKGAQLSYRQGKPVLEQVFDMPTDVEHQETSERTSPLDLSSEGRQLYEMIDKHLVITALPTQEVLIRPLEVKLTKQRDVDAVLSFQAEPLLPYPPEDALIDRIVLKKTSEATELTLCATKKTHVENHIDFWQSLHIEPEVVSCTPAALATFATHFFPSEEPYLVLHLGMKETFGLLIKDNKLIAAYPCQISVLTLLDTLKKEDISDVNFQEIKDLELFNRWKLEVTKIFFSLEKQIPEKTKTILITGNGGNNESLASALCEKFSQTLSTPKATSEFPITEAQLQKYAISIGMALSALPKYQNMINFRQEELVYPNPWKRLKKPLITYLLSAGLLAFAFYIFGNSYLTSRQDELKAEYVRLVSFMHKPYSEFEEEYIKKFPSETKYPEDVKPLTFDHFSNRISQIEKIQSALPETFPLQPKVPLPSDVLAWLSSHPSTVTKNEETGELSPLITIESVHYTIVKRPEKTRRQDKYQVKLDIEFTSTSPKYAREFHDVLLAPNDFIDPNSEVKWNASQGKYRTSFLLKDKTQYPAIRGS